MLEVVIRFVGQYGVAVHFNPTIGRYEAWFVSEECSYPVAYAPTPKGLLMETLLWAKHSYRVQPSNPGTPVPLPASYVS